LDRLGTYCEDIEFIRRALKELHQLNLGGRIGTYLSLSDAQQLVEEMLTPGRGDNCLITFEPEEISDILTHAFL